MGGKSKLFDPEKLEPIYRESREFTANAKLSLQTIQKQLNQLNEYMTHGDLSYEEEDRLKDTVIHLGDLLGAFKQSLEWTTGFAESQLAGTVKPAHERNTRAASAGKGTVINLKLRK